MMEQRLTMISLGVADLARSRAFYLDGLGWQEREESSEHIVFIPMNGFCLGLYPHSELAADARVEEDRSVFRGFALAHNVGSPEQVDKTLRFAESAGADIVKPGQKTEWGGYAGYFSDPDGFLWEVACGSFLDPQPLAL